MSIPVNSSSMPEMGRRFALVVGVNYAPNSNLPPLNYAVADAKEMATVLQQFCHFELLVPPLLDEKATSDNVKRAVRKLARDRRDEDFLLLYYSGHGQPMTGEASRQDIYLVTQDFAEIDVEEDENAHFSMRWLRDKLYIPTRAGSVILILDCCYAGDIGRAASDPYLEELQRRFQFYFGAPSSESGARTGGQRLALAATGHGLKALEKDGHGLMTGPLLAALKGEKEDAFDTKGQVSIELLYNSLKRAMPPEQQPSLSGDTAGRDCILASYPERVHRLQIVNKRPRNYIPCPRNPLFQPRLNEFERLESLYFGPETTVQPARVGLIGVVGIGGVGKTQLAVEFAYRCQEQGRFSGGIFWMTATGGQWDWQRGLADLAVKTDFLPPDDNESSLDNEVKRARHFCRYLENHADALLILDNVEDPTLVRSFFPALIGGEVLCNVLYTSRNPIVLPGVMPHPVELLTEEGAVRLLLKGSRPALLAEIEGGDSSEQKQAALEVCRGVGYLPLALVHLHGLLEREKYKTLMELREELAQRGILEMAKQKYMDAQPLYDTFRLSWDKVEDEGARHLFKLATYFPEAAPIPRWVLGIAAGLKRESVGRACAELEGVSLVEVLSGEQIQLHPLVREFGQQLVAQEHDSGKTFLQEAAQRLIAEFTDLTQLETYANAGYWISMEQVRAARAYIEQLNVAYGEPLRRMERWLERESYILGNEQWWPDPLPELFRQQLFNRAVEEGGHIPLKEGSVRWLRQLSRVGAADRSLLKVFTGHKGSVTSVAFSPNMNYVLSGSEDRTARIWETVSGKLLTTLEGHTDAVQSVAFAPDGNKMLTGSWDNSARLWETVSGKLMNTFEGHADHVECVTFSPDGSKVLTGSRDGTARLWETASGELLTTLEGHSDFVTSVAFSPDGNKVLTGSWDRTARLWETTNAKLLTKLEGHTHWVTSVAFAPDGSKMLTGSFDKTARLWETVSGKLMNTFEGHADHVECVTFSPDGSKVLTGSRDGTARLWETANGKSSATLQGHTGTVTSVAFSSDGSKVLTGSRDGTARLWETASAETPATLEPDTGPLWTMVFSPDGSKVLTSSGNQTAALWKTANGKLLITLRDHMQLVTNMAFSPDGSKVLTGSVDQTARLWETASGKLLTILVGHTGSVQNVAFSPDGSKVLTGSRDGTARLWETASGKLLIVLKEHNDSVTSVAFSPDGSTALTGSYDGTTRLWETASGKLLAILEGHTGSVQSVTFSPDGSRVLTGSEDKTAKLWETKGGILVASLEGHMNWVTNVVISPDGSKVLTGSAGDKAVGLWEALSGNLLTNLKGHMYKVTSIAFSPDGQLVITCDEGGWVLFWCAKEPELGRLLGIYVATYKVGAVYWQDMAHLVLADMGGPQYHPHFYHLQLEGTW